MKNDIIIIGLTALPGGGKDYIGDFISKEYHFFKISPGDIIREKLAKMRNGKINRELIWAFAKSVEFLYETTFR